MVTGRFFEAGGLVDESRATLAVYGTDLEPERVTALLGVNPTSSVKRGYRMGPRSPARPHGAWFLKARGRAPNGPDVQLTQLLDLLPDSVSIWEELKAQYRVEFRLSFFLTCWNRGFDLPAELIARVARIGVAMNFDIYFT